MKDLEKQLEIALKEIEWFETRELIIKAKTC